MTDIVLEEVNLPRRTPSAKQLGTSGAYQQIAAKTKRKINFGLTQYSRLRGDKRTVYVFDKHYLSFRENKGREKIIDISFLATEPETILKVAWFNLLLTSICALLACWSFFQALLPIQDALALAGIAVIFLLLTVSHSSHRAIFYTEKGEIPLFELYINLPNSARYEKLLNELQLRIKNAKKQLPKDRNKIAMDIEEHRRLHKTGAISKEQYEIAKRNIVNNFS